MKRRLFALLMAFCMGMTLAACGNKKDTAPSGAASSQAASSQAASSQAAVSSEDAASSGDAASSEDAASSGDAASSQNAAKPAEQPQKPAKEPPAQKPVQPAPQPQPEPQPEQPPAQSAGVDLTAVYDSLAAAHGENWPAMTAMTDAETLEMFYPGLGDIATKQCAVYMPMISAVAAEIVLVQVEKEGDVQAVKDILQSRINYQVGDDSNPGGAWYPASIESWKTNSRIVSNGCYIMLAVYSDVDSVVTEFNALF